MGTDSGVSGIYPGAMRITLGEGSRVVILGGGPGGSFFAIQLLQQAKRARKNINVIIIDRQKETIKECDFCVSIISPRVQNELAKNHIQLPPQVICEKFTHIWIHGLWKNFPLKIPAEQALFSVFRGILRPSKTGAARGLDEFLLHKAIEAGAKLIIGEAQAIEPGPCNKTRVIIQPVLGEPFSLEAEFTCVCTGLPPGPGHGGQPDRLVSSYQRINPLFKPAKVRPRLMFELKPGRLYLKKYMNQEFYLMVTGSKTLSLDHILLVPRGEYLTVALVGKSIDRASLPEDSQSLIKNFLSLAHIQEILPGLTLENTTIACTCCSYMAVDPARAPFSHGIAMAGDALGARLYRDGLFSAFVSARALAHTVIHMGVDEKSLSRGYGWVRAWLKTDNFYGRLVIGFFQTVLRSRLLNRILYQTFASEMKFKPQDKWPLGKVLWRIGSGDTDYHGVVKELVRGPVVLSILKGTIKTLRNILTELFFGLNWEAYGRYPTVIIKEKRAYIKQSMARPLGINLEASPDMERMYAIKIRASAQRIFQELGKFGDPDSKFLRIRFVDVSRISGLPNQEGSVVRYCLKMVPIFMDIHLVQSLTNRALLYRPDGLFTRQGKLAFDIRPTRDGNNRLVIYTAFDFRQGKTPLGRLFWNLFKRVFPDYAHDVVWNHAICCIKGEAEKTA